MLDFALHFWLLPLSLNSRVFVTLAKSWHFMFSIQSFWINLGFMQIQRIIYNNITFLKVCRSDMDVSTAEVTLVTSQVNNISLAWLTHMSYVSTTLRWDRIQHTTVCKKQRQHLHFYCISENIHLLPTLKMYKGNCCNLLSVK